MGENKRQKTTCRSSKSNNTYSELTEPKALLVLLWSLGKSANSHLGQWEETIHISGPWRQCFLCGRKLEMQNHKKRKQRSYLNPCNCFVVKQDLLSLIFSLQCLSFWTCRSSNQLLRCLRMVSSGKVSFLFRGVCKEWSHAIKQITSTQQQEDQAGFHLNVFLGKVFYFYSLWIT